MVRDQSLSTLRCSWSQVCKQKPENGLLGRRLVPESVLSRKVSTEGEIAGTTNDGSG